MRVVVTGAAGSIGTVVRAGLAARGHDVVAVDRLDFTAPEVAAVVVADVLDADAMRAAADGADAVVHLASRPDEATLPEILDSHVLTCAGLLEAMLDSGVRRLVYASSNHAVGRTPRTDLLRTDTPPRPDTFYGVGKVAAEALCRLYADRHGIGAVACRIGSFGPQPTSRRELSTWLSHEDAVRMVHAALTAPHVGFALVYGVSANTRGWWDLEPGRALGFVPQDDAEDYAEELLATPETEDDRFEASYVGGPLVGDDVIRPAFE